VNATRNAGQRDLVMKVRRRSDGNGIGVPAAPSITVSCWPAE